MRDSLNCSKGEIQSWFVILLIFSCLFSLVTITTLILAIRFILHNPQYPLKDLLSRILLCIALLTKSLLLIFQTASYNGLDLHSFETFVISFGGYAINIAYLSIIYQWCDVFISVVGGIIEKLFLFGKKSTIVIIALSLIQYIITAITKANGLRAVFSIIWNFLVLILFVGITIILHSKLEIHYKFELSPEQTVLNLCTLCSVALFTRIICYIIYFAWYMNKPAEIAERSMCDTKQLINYSIKELIGQLIPFVTVNIADYLSHQDNREYVIITDNMNV